MDAKSIEEMVHEYTVARINSGNAVTLDDIRSFCLLARDIKGEAELAQRKINNDQQRRRW